MIVEILEGEDDIDVGSIEGNFEEEEEEEEEEEGEEVERKEKELS